MLPGYQNSLDLLTDVTNNRLYQQLIIQLNKDVHLTGIDVVFAENSTPLILKEQLQNTIKDLFTHHFDMYTNLLYRIDVSEKEVLTATSSDMNSYTEHITFLILKRVWKKVWFKNQFSK